MKRQADAADWKKSRNAVHGAPFSDDTGSVTSPGLLQAD